MFWTMPGTLVGVLGQHVQSGQLLREAPYGYSDPTNVSVVVKNIGNHLYIATIRVGNEKVITTSSKTLEASNNL
jgi:hypothetical protein